MKRRLLFLCAALLMAVVPLSVSRAAYAHYVLTDPGTGREALVHVEPDDDPVAGETSYISFDFSSGEFVAAAYDYVLTVKGEANDVVTVPTTAQGRDVIGEYTFPAKGAYVIDLTATPKADAANPLKYSYTQRVTRGEDSTENQTAENSRAGNPGRSQIAIYAGLVILAAVLILIVNYWERIITLIKPNSKGTPK